MFNEIYPVLIVLEDRVSLNPHDGSCSKDVNHEANPLTGRAQRGFLKVALHSCKRQNNDKLTTDRACPLDGVAFFICQGIMGVEEPEIVPVLVTLPSVRMPVPVSTISV